MKRPGFTLLEILIVVGIFLMVFAFTAPITFSQLYGKTAEAEAKQLASSIFDLQQKAYTGSQNSSYGISFAQNYYTTFRGNNFASGVEKDQSNIDSKSSISSVNLNPAGSELVFTKGSLKPTAWGTIAISSTGFTYMVEINKQGFVTYYKQ